MGWYSINKRDLPWRRTNNPYYIWISEIILQQTRVEQGRAYYERFIKRFPSVKDLALASIDEVLKLWQGLGYYSRAVNLHNSAISIYGTGSIFPQNYAELLKLKGVGEYTAAAIASIAYNEPVPLVDGNVSRVISRYFGISQPLNHASTKKEIFAKATELFDPKAPGNHNQALMELGALICTPQPDCYHCPVSKKCVAHIKGIASQLPVKLAKNAVKMRYIYFFVIESDHKLVIKKRNEKDIWKGLYDFPSIEKQRDVSIKKLLNSKEFADMKLDSVDQISKVYVHKLTHQTIQARFITARMSSPPKNTDWKLVTRKEIKYHALPKLIENYINKDN